MADAPTSNLGDLLSSLRINRMMTQRQLAQTASVSIEVVGSLERGSRHSVQPITALRLFRALASAQSLTESEARRFADLTDIPDSALVPPYVTPEHVAQPSSTSLHAAAEGLAEAFGYDLAIAGIEQLRAAWSIPLRKA